MNRNLKIILGILLIVIGVGCILNLLDIYILSFSGFIKSVDLMWPLFLVVIGLFLLYQSKKIRAAVLAVMIVLMFAGTIYFTTTSHYNLFNNNHDFNFNEHYNDSDNFFNN
ncbi:hypothetical protein [Anaerofustis sp. NSJ-163]|uniref:LiaF transmembrane domain-containing protein n=1 Tax=Anaerofustis sp. NSJ-163 TaxID=2944391 RepID=UPI00209C2E9A|nr:hypothetical protein [Anaerofustis sp. NSJ-163]MCO8194220.1 hypothetical protein [Anaerofustis sp. NSJ-163]